MGEEKEYPELKPCPFCGNINVNAQGYHHEVVIFCENCFAQGSRHECSKDAGEAWNCRPLDDNVLLKFYVQGVERDMEIAKLKEMLSREWISVGDELPKECGFYLVTDGKDRYVVDFYVTSGWGSMIDDYYTDATFSSSEVTHWMLLPEPLGVKDE